jgi:hypothetical protein
MYIDKMIYLAQFWQPGVKEWFSQQGIGLFSKSRQICYNHLHEFCRVFAASIFVRIATTFFKNFDALPMHL